MVIAQRVSNTLVPLNHQAATPNLPLKIQSVPGLRIQSTEAARFPQAERSPTNPAGQVAPRGLTLLELLVALAIIGILAALAVPCLAAAKSRRRASVTCAAVAVCGNPNAINKDVKIFQLGC